MLLVSIIASAVVLYIGLSIVELKKEKNREK
jgi:hypothetical protein